MSTSEISPPFAFRPLDAGELGAAHAVAEAAGVHGVYVRNALEGRDFAAGRDRLFGMWSDGGLFGVVYFGARGNLVVVECEPVEPDAVASRVRACDVEWRIALGRAEVVGALARLERRAPLVDREQVYYATRTVRGARPVGRLAVRKDARALMAAALDLNDSDLNVAPWRVNRGWLRDTVRRRIREQRTFVVGEPGAPLCKLDVGSRGPAGAVLEGVYTKPSERGAGLAAALVADVADRELASAPLVCLHVAAENTPARRAYERAGMAMAGRFRLLLRG